MSTVSGHRAVLLTLRAHLFLDHHSFEKVFRLCTAPLTRYPREVVSNTSPEILLQLGCQLNPNQDYRCGKKTGYNEVEPYPPRNDLSAGVSIEVEERCTKQSLTNPCQYHQ
jgi:hypothetical protein